jgi:hypothetical protein
MTFSLLGISGHLLPLLILLSLPLLLIRTT